MSLKSNAVSGVDLEGTTLALWAEFLASYFDGGEHRIGAGPSVVFPKAAIRFQESALPQPLGSPEAEGATVGISVVWVEPSVTAGVWDHPTAAEAEAMELPATGRQQRMMAACGWLFLIRAVGNAQDNAQKQVQSAGGRLYGLLENSMATKPLAEKGIHRLRPVPARMAFPGDKAPSGDLSYKLRVLSCAGQVRWMVASQGQG